jgi:hypothetical protein
LGAIRENVGVRRKEKKTNEEMGRARKAKKRMGRKRKKIEKSIGL